MLRFIDGFDHYASAQVGAKWTATAGPPTITTVNARNGSALSLTSPAFSVTKTIDAQASWVVGVAVRFSSLTAAAFLRLLDAGTVQVDLRLNADGTLSLTRAGTAVTGGTSVAAVALSTWYYIECKVTIADSIGANSCKVRLNGTDIITVATGQDLKNTGNASANQVQLLGTGGAALLMDDFYICDGTGSTNNDFLGDVRVEALYPSGAGTTTQFTPSAGANYTCVDDATPNDDTDYVESSTPGQKDTYAMGDLSSTPATIKGIQTCLYARKTDAGARSVAPVVRSGGADFDGATVALADTYAYLLEVRETDPGTAAAWTAAGVNAIEAGVKLVA